MFMFSPLFLERNRFKTFQKRALVFWFPIQLEHCSLFSSYMALAMRIQIVLGKTDSLNGLGFLEGSVVFLWDLICF